MAEPLVFDTIKAEPLVAEPPAFYPVGSEDLAPGLGVPGQSMAALGHLNAQRVVNAAARKGVALEVQPMPGLAHSAEEVARAVHAELGQIVTPVLLVASRPEGRLAPIVFLASGDGRFDLGLLAAMMGEVSVRRATAREATELTGCPDDGIPPFGHTREVRVVMDQALCQYRSVWATAGSNTGVFQIAPGTLRMLSNAVIAPLSHASWVRGAGFQFEPRA